MEHNTTINEVFHFYIFLNIFNFFRVINKSPRILDIGTNDIKRE